MGFLRGDYLKLPINLTSNQKSSMCAVTVAKSSLAIVNVDTTVQDKAVTFPTDARLLHKARIALVRLAQR